MTMENILWMRLLTIAEQINHASSVDQTLIENSVAEINTLVESYDRQFDPADHFQEYVITLFSKAILRVLKNHNL